MPHEPRAAQRDVDADDASIMWPRPVDERVWVDDDGTSWRMREDFRSPDHDVLLVVQESC